MCEGQARRARAGRRAVRRRMEGIYLQSAPAHHLVFAPRLDSPFEIYVDSSWEVKFSSSGALLFYGGCLIAWFSKVQRSVSFSCLHVHESREDADGCCELRAHRCEPSMG